jgi:uncharacterized membrane protein
MWQHLLNIIFGLVLLMVGLGAMGMGALTPLLTLIFGLLGVVIAMVALGGMFEVISKRPQEGSSNDA